MFIILTYHHKTPISQDNNLRIREIFSILTQGVEMIQYDSNPQSGHSSVNGRIVWMVIQQTIYNNSFQLSAFVMFRILIYIEFVSILCDQVWQSEPKEKFLPGYICETFLKSEKVPKHFIFHEIKVLPESQTIVFH